MAYHIAFVRPDIIDKIRQGTKTVESRLAKKRPPAWDAKPGDILLFKETGGAIVLQAEIRAVHRFEHLTPEVVRELAVRFSPAMGSSPLSPYWAQKEGSKYAVFLELTNIKSITFPRCRTPQGVRAAWVSNFPMGFLAKDSPPPAHPEQATLW